MIVSPQVNIHRQYRENLENQELDVSISSPNDLLVLHQCEPFTNLTKRCHGDDQFNYPEVLTVRYATCLVFQFQLLNFLTFHFINNYILEEKEVILMLCNLC